MNFARLLKQPGSRGIAAALAAALLFGAGTPLAKLLLAHASPWLLAALLYLGSGLGLWLMRVLRGKPHVTLPRGEMRWLLGAILAGGVVGPVLLMQGLALTPASSSSLLLNAEGVLTALIAWVIFRENFDKRIAAGMLAIVAGGLVLAWPSQLTWSGDWHGPVLVVAACLAWAIDNNFTRKVSLADASWIAMVKGLAAGATNLALALFTGAQWPSWPVVIAAGAVGFASYGASLALFVVALRELGTARTGAYFSVAPFFGTVLAVAFLGESWTVTLVIAFVLMAIGVALHLAERHEHGHSHVTMDHAHAHSHGPDDPHHEHPHDSTVVAGVRHSHPHRHEPMTHSHPHFPDAHHRHEH